MENKKIKIDNVVIKSTDEYANKKFEYKRGTSKKKFSTRKTSKKKKRKKNRNLVGIILLIVVCIFMVLVFLNKSSQVDIFFGNSKLKYTHNKNKNSHSVYMLDVSDIVKDIMPSMVAIKGGKEEKESNKYDSNGSGMIIGKNDKEVMILTNYHVIEGINSFQVEFISGKSFDAKVKGISKDHDIAILSINTNSLDKNTSSSIKVITVGYSKDLKVGEGVFAIGNSLGYGQSVTTGVISALDREIEMDGNTYHMIQTDAAINVGNSGGALVNHNGEVIGINCAKYSGMDTKVEGISFAIPITDVSGIITKLMNESNNQ